MESVLQRRIIKDLEKKGWWVNKIKLCSVNGWPDIQAMKMKEIVFIEVKDAGKKARPLQEFIQEKIKERGFVCCTISSFEQYLDLKL